MAIELIGSSGNVANVDSSGNLFVTLADVGSPAPANITQVDGTALGAPTGWGTAPSGNVIGVNADLFIAGTIAAASASGVQKVGNVGSSGAVFDAAPGAAAPANGLQVGGTDGTDFRAFLTDSTGQQKVLIENTSVTVAQSTAANLLCTSASEGSANGSTAPPTDASYQGYAAATSLPTAATATDLVGGMADKFGRQVVLSQGPRDIIGTQSYQSTSSSPATFIGQIASTFTDITTLILTNEGATSTIVSLSDGTTTYKFALAANGGGSFPCSPPLPAASSNTNWTISNSAGNNVDCVAIYVKNK